MADWTEGDYHPYDPRDLFPEDMIGGFNDADMDALRHGFHGTRHDVVDRNGKPSKMLRAAVDMGGAAKDANLYASSPHFVNWWSPNPLITEGRGAFDPDDGVEEYPAEELRDDAEEKAWSYASAGQGRPRVYEGVAPNFPLPDDGRTIGVEPVQAHPSVFPTAAESNVAIAMAGPSFRVTDTHWIPPGKPGRAIQGTLPHVNWNQFGAPNVGNPEDVLHGYSGTGDFEFKLSRMAAKKEAEAAARPEYGPAVSNPHRDAERRSVEAGQMRLPGF